jgi:glycosyltransferase involved in cell wall biosynthesis
MKILIDGQTLLTPEITRGIGKYFISSVENILRYDFTNDFFLATKEGPHLDILSPWARNKLRILSNDAYDPSSHLKDGEQSYSEVLNDDIVQHGVDVYWSPNALMDNVVLPTRLTSSCKFAVTIFDLIIAVMERDYAKHQSASSLARYKNKLKRLERDFDIFIHISCHTELDFRKALNVEDKTHIVTPLAVDSHFVPLAFPCRASRFDYVIYPGGFDPRKNLERTVEAFARLQAKHGTDEKIQSTKLYIVCNYDRASENQLMSHARKHGIGDQVLLTGFVGDSEFIRLYQNARCLFFPSLYEGFGLPVLEGLACGLPVATSNTSSLPEVGGHWAFYFDPYNIEEMAQCLYEALRAPIDSESRLRRYEYSREFSWKKTAFATLNAFEIGYGR